MTALTSLVDEAASYMTSSRPKPREHPVIRKVAILNKQKAERLPKAMRERVEEDAAEFIFKVIIIVPLLDDHGRCEGRSCHGGCVDSVVLHTSSHKLVSY